MKPETEKFLSKEEEINRGLFLNGLRAGLGLSLSAKNIGYTAQQVSDVVQDSDEFKKTCLTSLFIGYNAKLSLIKLFSEKKKFFKWQDEVNLLPRFVTNLNLWEQYCKASEMDDEKLMNAILLYKIPEEVATVTGMPIHKFYELLLSKDAFYEFFKEHGIKVSSW